MCANSESSGETAQMGRLAWAFAGHLCDKYHNLIYNAITQNICFIVGLHKYDVYLRNKNTCKVHLNWPNKDCISIFIERNVI